MSKKETLKFVGAFYAGGMLGSWLATSWAGFDEFPFREIGALLWPLLVTNWMGVN